MSSTSTTSTISPVSRDDGVDTAAEHVETLIAEYEGTLARFHEVQEALHRALLHPTVQNAAQRKQLAAERDDLHVQLFTMRSLVPRELLSTLSV